MEKDTGGKKILARGKVVSDGVVLFKGTIPPSYLVTAHTIRTPTQDSTI